MATSILNKSSADDSEIIDGSGKINDELETLRDLRKTDNFDKVQMKLKKLGGRVNLTELVERMSAFDPGE